MTPVRASARVLRGLVAAAVLVALVGGVPVLLLRFVGSPIPSRLPDVGAVLAEIERRGISDTAVVDAIAFIVWIAWARFSLCIALEVAAVVRRRPTLERRSLGSSQRVAAGLVAAVVALVGTLGGAVGAGAAQSTPIVADRAGSASRAVEPVEPASRRWLVERHDSLWGIAEDALGDGMRWREIVELNLGREVAPGVVFDAYTESIQPGWHLVLPADGDRTGPDGPSIERAGSATRIVVQPGDTLASLADEVYGSAAEWPTLWDANAHREFGARSFDDPDVILPGWELIIPDDVASSPPVDLPDLGDGERGRAGEPQASGAESIRFERLRPALERASMAAPGPDGEMVGTDAVAECPVAEQTAPGTGVEHAATASPETSPPASPDMSSAALPEAGPGSADDGQTDASGRPAIPEMALGVGMTLLGTGAISLLTSLRRRRLRAAGRDVRELGPDAASARVERLLRSVSDDERLARVDVVVRAAVAHLAATSQPARLIAVVAAADGSVELWLDGTAPLPPTGFSAPTPARWNVSGHVGLDAVTGGPRFAAFPCPSLAQIGRQGTSDVFVDLEACGLLVVAPDDSVAADVVRAMIGSLAFSPLGEHVRVLAVGSEHTPSPDRGCVEHLADVDVAIDRAAELVSPILAVLPEHDTTAALRLRSAGETWDPVVVAITSDVSRALAAELPTLTEPPGRGLAIVTACPVPDARWRIARRGESWHLDPVGLEFEPSLLPPASSDALIRLIDDAREPLVVLDAPRPSSLHHLPVSAPFEEVPWSLMVRMLGPLDIVDRDGTIAHFERAKAAELVAWLVEHRDAATRSRARAALWGQPIQDSTFANVVSDARRGLTSLVVPPAGEEWIGRTLTEQLPLHRLIVSDAAILDARRRWAIGRPTSEAEPVLRAGLELVRDVPFSGAGVLWADAEGVVSNLLLLVVAAATDLAERYLELGRPDDVFWATAKGLAALPGHEELIAIRMRVHADAGDLAGVRTEWESYERVLAADPWGDASPSPKLVELRRRMLSPTPAR